MTTFIVITIALVASNVTFALTGFTKNVFFNCEQYDERSASCYPSKVPVDGKFTTGTSQKIYTLSSKEGEYSEGQYDRALRLSSYLGEYVTVDKSNDFTFTKFTISFWVKRAEWFHTYAPILSFLNLNSTGGWTFDLQDNGTRARFGLSNGSGLLTTTNGVLLNSSRYDNLVGVFDGSNVILYVNGKLYSKVPYTGNYVPPNVKLRIGLESYYNRNSWGGRIDDLRIYDKALTSSEVSALYQNFSALPTTNLIGHWTFDGNLNDSSNRHNDATLRTEAVSMAYTPDDRMFFTEKRTGEVRIMFDDDKVLDSPFANITGLYEGDHQGLLGITIDPKFETNHYVYVYITYEDVKNHEPFNGVVRFTDVNNHGTNATLLLSRIPADKNGNYAGGALAFGPDDKLYVTVGMGSSPSAAQVKASLVGKVLRINRDGTIPDDNPFPHSPVYTIGHRNMYGIAFDSSGRGLLTENGDTHFDELNMLEKGQNYGFPKLQYPTLASIENNSSFVSPIREYDRTIAPAQAIYYTGDKFPEIKNSFIIVSYNDGNIHSVRITEKDNQTYVEDLVIDFKRDFPDNIVSVAQSPSGDLYYGGYSIYKVQKIHSETQQRVFPVATNLTDGVNIENMHLSAPEKSLFLHVVYTRGPDSNSNGVMKLDIPALLLSHAFSVSVKDTLSGKEVDKSVISSIYSQQRGIRTTAVQFEFSKDANVIISINGAGTDVLLR